MTFKPWHIMKMAKNYGDGLNPPYDERGHAIGEIIKIITISGETITLHL